MINCITVHFLNFIYYFLYLIDNYAEVKRAWITFPIEKAQGFTQQTKEGTEESGVQTTEEGTADEKVEENNWRRDSR